MFTTRDGFRKWLQEVSTWVAAALIGVAVMASISVILLPLGMWLVLAGVAVFLVGLAVSWLIPACWSYRAVMCPYCRQINQVRLGIGRFQCSFCTGSVKVKGNQGRNVLTLVLPRKKLSKIV